MAVHFVHNFGFSQAVLRLTGGASGVSLPFTFASHCKLDEEFTGAARKLIRFLQVGGQGDRFDLEISDAAGEDPTVTAIAADFIFSEKSTASFTFGDWAHAAAVFEGSGNVTSAITAYANGIAGGTNTNPISPDSVADIIIGGNRQDSTGTSGFTGCIAYAAIWQIALSAAQIALLAAGTRPDNHAALGTSGANLVGYWQLTNAATATVATVGSDLTLYDAPPDAYIETCVDSPDEPAPIETGETGECAEDEADVLAEAFTWPKCDLTPGSINVEVVSPTVSPGRSFTGIEQIVQPDAGFWRITLRDIPIRSRADALLWRDNESRANGRNNPVLVPVYEAKLSGTPIAATAAEDYGIGTTNIGIAQSAGETIRAGMHFSDGQWLYRIARIISSDGGSHDVRLFPPLRAAISEDDALDFNDPVCRCRLERDDGMDVNLELLRFAKPMVVFVEDV